MTAKVPFKTLKFGPYTVAVKVMTAANKKIKWGQFLFNDQQMRVHDNYPTKAFAAETVLHEALHGIADEREVKLSEAEVLQLSKGIFAFFRDNPDFRRWFVRCLG